jgi:hypothetical protein
MIDAGRITPSKQSRKEQRKSQLKLTEAQAALGWAAVLMLVAVLGAIYLHQTSRIAGVGRHVQLLQYELDELKRSNAGLERQIAQAQTLERLQVRAQEMGFIRASAENVEYLIIPNYPAEPGSEPLPAAQRPKPTADSLGEALWQSFRSSVGDLIHGEAQ